MHFHVYYPMTGMPVLNGALILLFLRRIRPVMWKRVYMSQSID